MKKNWYIIYTKPRGIKKVTSALTKMKVRHFLPLVTTMNSFGMNRETETPLFPGYVFVFVTAGELPGVQQAVNALSIVYWKGKPAVIPAEDIEAIENFTSCHKQIRLVHTKVNAIENRSAADEPAFVVNETIVTSQKPTFLNVSSMGVTLVAIGDDTDMNSLFNYQINGKDSLRKDYPTIFSNS